MSYAKLFLALCLVSASACHPSKWRVRDPYGIMQLGSLAKDVSDETKEEERQRIDAEMRASLCGTPNGRVAVAKEAALSATDDIVPCPEP